MVAVGRDGWLVVGGCVCVMAGLLDWHCWSCSSVGVVNVATLREKPSGGSTPSSMHLMLTATAPVAATEAMRSRVRNMTNHYGGGKDGGGKGGKGGDDHGHAAGDADQWNQWQQARRS